MVKFCASCASTQINTSLFTSDPISVQLVFISQMLQITETNKVVYDVSLDTFKDCLESAAEGKLEGHG